MKEWRERGGAIKVKPMKTEFVETCFVSILLYASREGVPGMAIGFWLKIGDPGAS